MKMKLLLLLTIVATCFTSISFGQGTPVSNNTVTRTACLAGYTGCYDGQVILRLSGSVGKSATFPASTTYSNDYPYLYTKITVTVAGLTSTGTFYLPTNIGDQTAFNNGLDDGVHHSYMVIITKTADKQYTLAVSDTAY